MTQEEMQKRIKKKGKGPHKCFIMHIFDFFKKKF